MDLLFYRTGAITVYLFFIIICLTLILGTIAIIVYYYNHDIMSAARVYISVWKQLPEGRKRYNLVTEFWGFVRQLEIKYKPESD